MDKSRTFSERTTGATENRAALGVSLDPAEVDAYWDPERTWGRTLGLPWWAVTLCGLFFAGACGSVVVFRGEMLRVNGYR